MFIAYIVAPLLLTTDPSTAVRDDARPSPELALTIVAPDITGPWKLIAENRSNETVRFAADGRLLSLAIEPPALTSPVDSGPSAAEAGPAARRGKPKPPPVVHCTLPSSLRPAGVVDSRALLLKPGERYEEVFSPALFCFAPALARALVPGARVTAHFGFPLPPPKRGKKPMPLLAPFVVEPTSARSELGPAKELIADTFTLVAGDSASSASEDEGGARRTSPDDERAPNVALMVPARVDAASAASVALSLKIKNTGGRPAWVHLRRDNFTFHVDGPNDSADCGRVIEHRRTARDLFASLKPNATMSADVWLGELCPNGVFDRPGLYRVGVSVAFPKTANAAAIEPWATAVTAEETVLVRVREGRLPFYVSPPEALGGGR